MPAARGPCVGAGRPTEHAGHRDDDPVAGRSRVHRGRRDQQHAAADPGDGRCLPDQADQGAEAFRLDAVPGVAVIVEKAVGRKCARSWKILESVGEDAEYPDVSPRDAQALREWKALGVSV